MEATRHYGIYRGQVVDDQDPEQLQRVRAVVPQLLGSMTTPWAWPVTQRTTGFEPPKPGDPVWVMFEGGDIDHPAYLGVWVPVNGRPFPATALTFSGLPTTIVPDASAAGGVSSYPARTDHVHAIVADVASTAAFSDAAAEGVSTSFARSDHRHGMPADPVIAHVAATDPHPQYATDTDVTTTNANLATETAARIAGDAANATAITNEATARVVANDDITALHWMTRLG